MQAVTVAPDLHRVTIMERLLKEMAPLQDRLWLVNDDVHELGSAGRSVRCANRTPGVAPSRADPTPRLAVRRAHLGALHGQIPAKHRA